MAESAPKYQAVIDWVKHGIETGEMKSGDRLLSEKELSEKFGLSRQTIRHATGELEQMRVITRVRGSGTYIGQQEIQEKRTAYMNICIIVTYLDNYIFPPTLRGMSDELRKEGYTTQFAFTDDDVLRERDILQGILENDRIDGLVVEPTKAALPSPNLDYYRTLKERNIPILFFNAEYPQLNLPCIRLDDENVAERAVQLLADSGHEKIAGCFQLDDRQGALRYYGFLNGVIKNGLPMQERNIVWMDTQAVRHPGMLYDFLFHRIEGCTAIVCYNDNVALKLIEECVRRGIRVPEDLSVVGIDDAAVSGTCSTPITTFPHPKETLGRTVADTIVHMIRDPAYDGNKLYRPEPIIRDSILKIK